MNVSRIVAHVVERLNWYEDGILRGVRDDHVCKGCDLLFVCHRCPFGYDSDMSIWCRPWGVGDCVVRFRVGTDDERDRVGLVEHYKNLRKSCYKWCRKHSYKLNLAKITEKEYNKFIKGEV